MTVNIYDMAQTWNNGATTFAGIKLNVTDTASASGSLLMDLQLGGAAKFKVDKNGDVVLGVNGIGRSVTANALSYSGALTLRHLSGDDVRLSTIATGTPALGFYSIATQYVQLLAPSANTLEMRRSTNAQTFNIYNTYTSASHYERGFMRWSGNALQIGVEAAGGGSTRVVHISNLPTSNPGVGILWNNAGTPAIGT